MVIHEVWRSNFDFEMVEFARCLSRYNVISIDTEFPGNLVSTPRTTSEVVRYGNTKRNVDQTKIIQLGITLSAVRGQEFITWQFNFSDFDPAIDAHNESSIDLLVKNGIDFGSMKKHGVDSRVFAIRFTKLITTVRRTLHWVTFHGLYDIAYLLKIVTGGAPLPATVDDFTATIGKIFGFVYDVKHMCRYCDGLFGGELGLEKLARILHIDRIGVNHQAGSDSLLTAMVFEYLNRIYSFGESQCLGFLYGIDTRVISFRPVYSGKIIPVPVRCVPVEAASWSWSEPINSEPNVSISPNQFGYGDYYQFAHSCRNVISFSNRTYY